MSQQRHDTFLVHMNHERMLTSVSPEQCQRLVKAMFKLARAGEVEDMGDDLIIDIFWEQISSFMINNEKSYSDACKKKAERQKARWEEYRKLKAEAEERGSIDASMEEPDDELPFGRTY